MKLNGETRINQLLTEYPFLEDFLAAYHPKFEMLRNRMARATIGRIATLRTVSGIADIDLVVLVRAIAAEIEARTGVKPQLTVDAARALKRDGRLEELKAIILELHDGGDLEDARARFATALQDVEATEIAEMEEQLIRGGMPVSEVQRLCDVHIGAFREALDQHDEIPVPAGHPVDTYMAANRLITGLANHLGALAIEMDGGVAPFGAFDRAAGVLEALAGLENHYERKEFQLFPLLERHRITGPSQVMSGIHGQIRRARKELATAVTRQDIVTFVADAPALARDIVEMVYKEEKILFPLALQRLDDREWAEIRRGEDELGYVLVRPAADWPRRRVGPVDRPGADESVPFQRDQAGLVRLVDEADS